MLSWKIIKITISASIAEIIALLTGAILLMLVYNFHLDETVVIYPFILTFVTMTIYLLFKAFKLAKFYQHLETCVLAMPSAIITEDIIHEKVFETIRDIHNSYLADLNQLKDHSQTKNALFTQLIHSMKTATSISGLACEKLSETVNETALTDVMIENKKLTTSLEQALNILRMDAFVNDYHPEKSALCEIVTDAINDYKRDFIYNGIYPRLTGVATVYTDHKWCRFLIGQFITNGIKYSPKGSQLHFNLDQQAQRTRLQIIDHGIGIPASDLPRIFDLFYTGVNGKTVKSATGIGLFMSKTVADNLKIALEISSTVGSGTTVTLTFPAPKLNLTKM